MTPFKFTASIHPYLYIWICLFFMACQTDHTPATQNRSTMNSVDMSMQEPHMSGSHSLGRPMVDVDTRRPIDEISAMSLLMWDLADKRFIYGQDVIPYEIDTPLFSDYTIKDRAIYVPPEGKVEIDEAGLLILPYGSVTIKSFSYPHPNDPNDRYVIETRLMFLGERGWSAWPYVWNTEASEAYLSVSGAIHKHNDLPFLEMGDTLTYVVPQRNQCIDCHELKDGEQRLITPIGIKLRNFSTTSFEENGIIHTLIERGQLDAERVNDIMQRDRKQVIWKEIEEQGIEGLSADEINLAARDYLDINCAHCHNPQGAEGVSSQLFLHWNATDLFHLGVCKKPGSAGKGTFGFIYDIVPGKPEESILWLRLDTEEIGSMMPDFGRSLRHQVGVDLIYKWIEQLEGSCEVDE